MGMVFHTVHQLFGKGKNVVLDTIGSGETVTWPIYPLGEMVVGLLKSSIMVRIYS